MEERIILNIPNSEQAPVISKRRAPNPMFIATPEFKLDESPLNSPFPRQQKSLFSQPKTEQQSVFGSGVNAPPASGFVAKRRAPNPNFIAPNPSTIAAPQSFPENNNQDLNNNLDEEESKQWDNESSKLSNKVLPISLFNFKPPPELSSQKRRENLRNKKSSSIVLDKEDIKVFRLGDTPLLSQSTIPKPKIEDATCIVHDDPLDFAQEVFQCSFTKSFNDSNFIRTKIMQLVERTDQEVRSMSNKRYEQTHKATFTPASVNNSSSLIRFSHTDAKEPMSQPLMREDRNIEHTALLESIYETLLSILKTQKVNPSMFPIFANPVLSIKNIFENERMQNKIAFEMDTQTRSYLLYLIKLKVQEQEPIKDLINLQNSPYFETVVAQKKSFGFVNQNAISKNVKDRHQSVFNLNYQFNPIYFDEVSFAKFGEEFLDSVIDHVFSKVTKTEITLKRSSSRRLLKNMPKNKFLKEIVSILEVERCQLKFYNRVVNQFLEENQAMIQQLQSRQESQKVNLDASQVNSEIPVNDGSPSPISDSQPNQPLQSQTLGEENSKTLDTVEQCIVFINETLKLLMLSIFKRFKLIVHLLILLQKDDKNQNFSRQRVSHEQHSSTFISLLINSFWWFFHTIKTSIDQSDVYKMQSNQLYGGILCFKYIVSEIMIMLTPQVSKKQLTANRYYGQTLQKLTRFALFAEFPEQQQKKEAQQNDKKQHELLSKSNMMLRNIKREIIQQGNYGAVNDKIQSYKSFLKLIENNHMFKELIVCGGNKNTAVNKQWGRRQSMSDDFYLDVADQFVEDLRLSFKCSNDQLGSEDKLEEEPEQEPVFVGNKKVGILNYIIAEVNEDEYVDEVSEKIVSKVSKKDSQRAEQAEQVLVAPSSQDPQYSDESIEFSETEELLPNFINPDSIAQRSYTLQHNNFERKLPKELSERVLQLRKASNFEQIESIIQELAAHPLNQIGATDQFQEINK